MTMWHIRCEQRGEITDLDDQLADTPQEAIQKSFSNPDDWYLDRITSDEYQPCWHFKLRGTNVTVYVWENDSVCPECGAEDPFKPNKEYCATCRSEAYETVRDAEIRAGWDPTP